MSAQKPVYKRKTSPGNIPEKRGRRPAIGTRKGLLPESLEGVIEKHPRKGEEVTRSFFVCGPGTPFT